MITISSKSRYAVQALAELMRQGATPGGAPVPIAELARQRGIPLQFLEQLFGTLRRAGLLQSQRGVKGGYSFQQDPADITVLDIVQLLDGEFDAEAAAAGGANEVWTKAVNSLRAELIGTTIADVVAQEDRAAGASTYQI